MKKTIILLITTLFLTACGNIVVDVNLTDEERADLEAAIVEYQDKIKNYDPYAPAEEESDGTAGEEAAGDQPVNPAEGVTVITENVGEAPTTTGGVEVDASWEVDTRPPFLYFLHIARSQEDLGRLSEALSTYKRVMRLYENSQVAWNNMGRLYERMGKYDKAVKYYQKILNQYGFSQYYLDIARAYVRKGDPKAALKTYDQFRMLTNHTDSGLEIDIQNLRDRLKSNQ